MTKYITAVFLILFIYFEKYTFVKIENNSINTFYEVALLVFLLPLFLYGILSGFHALKREAKTENIKFSIFGRVLAILVLVVLAFSFYLNITRNVPSWDSAALYDARAVFLSHGIKFSEMLNISKYDPQNSYYYLLYPPFTSLVHFQWESLLSIPVGAFYSICLGLMALVIFIFSRRLVSDDRAILISLLTISNPAVFSSSIQEYTNLPFSLYLTTGIFLLGDYIKSKDLWKLIFGALLVISSQWIRFLEPLWVGVGFALLVGLLINTPGLRKKAAAIFGAFLLVGLTERFTWSNFVNNIAHSQAIVSFNPLSYLEPIIGIFSGSLVIILVFFVKSWGAIVTAHLAAISTVFISGTKDKELYFYVFVTIFSVAVYFSGLYFVSFQTVWWDKLGDSLVRSSTFLIPVSGLVLLRWIDNSRIFLKRK